ncbi:hypothetical protein LR48_Vigan07g151100 [Vigna angularis]|uniref:Uncharacterized protein n=1 Tax=Phaseolus angularis TaxID=3914 RepID=A0A0L9UYY8_PHAAN|nr:hypothetical protein LR48_Vigan07g151100 [Vigna angularis]
MELAKKSVPLEVVDLTIDEVSEVPERVYEDSKLGQGLDVEEALEEPVKEASLGDVSSGGTPSLLPLNLRDMLDLFYWDSESSFRMEHSLTIMPDFPSLWHLETCGGFMKSDSLSSPYE